MRAVCIVISPPHHIAHGSCSIPPHLLCLAVWQHHPKHTCTPKGSQSQAQPAATPTQVKIRMLLAVAACLFDYGPASRGLAGPAREAVTELQGSCSQKDLGSTGQLCSSGHTFSAGEAQEVACGLFNEGNLLPGLGSQTLALDSSRIPSSLASLRRNRRKPPWPHTACLQV